MEENYSLRGKLISIVVQDFYFNALGNCTLAYTLNSHLNFDCKVNDILRNEKEIVVTISYQDEERISKVMTVNVSKI